jgi:hypothetical protein
MRQVALDSNLLVLLVVGSLAPSQIAGHKRLRAYDVEDFELLCRHLDGAELVTTPNAMTEASNLIVYGVSEPLRSNLLFALKSVADIVNERYLASGQVMTSDPYRRLGLTDAAWLALSEPRLELLTDDLPLYLAASHAGMNARNFNHLRDR